MALQICAVLYPGDATEEGKLLRLKQQYFLCSASLQVIINFIWKHGYCKRNLSQCLLCPHQSFVVNCCCAILIKE